MQKVDFLLYGIFMIILCGVLWILYGRNFISKPFGLLVLTFISISIECLLIQISGSYLSQGGSLPAIVISPEVANLVGILFLRAIVFLLIGASLINYFFHGSNRGKTSFLVFRKDLLTDSKVRNISLAITPILLLFILINRNNILNRDSYLYIDSGGIQGFVKYLVPALGIFSIYLYWNSTVKGLNLCNFILCLTIEFSSASRAFAILVMAFFFTIKMKNRRLFDKVFIGATGINLGLISLGVSLFLRGQENQGLIPYLRYLSNWSASSINLAAIVGNFFVIIPITYLGLSIPTPNSYFFTSFNPLPGRYTDWYEIVNSMMLNPYTPTGSIAQVHNLGLLYEASIWIFVGVLVQYLGRIASHSIIVETISSVLVGLASFTLLQYSLRAGLRLVYIGLLIAILFRLGVKWGQKLRET